MKNLKNKIKRYVPIGISTKVKELQQWKKVDKSEAQYTFLRNEYGDIVKNYYLCDVNFGLDYSSTQGRIPRYIYWDRARYTLQNHFYVDDMLFVNKGKPQKKFGILLEPQTLQPQLYKSILREKRYFENEYDTIFTHSNCVLDSLTNAKPIIMGGVYVGTEYGGGMMSSNQYRYKKKNISIVSSDKMMCELHRFRYAIANKYNNSQDVDCFGTFNGKFVKIWESLAEYRYSFAIENCIEDYWITERICNCFASMTIPIYMGSPRIGDFFNLDGIIVIEKRDLEYIDEVIKKCNEKDYEQRLPAILDNYNRVQNYLCMEDWLYREYRKDLP